MHLLFNFKKILREESFFPKWSLYSSFFKLELSWYNIANKIDWALRKLFQYDFITSLNGRFWKMILSNTHNSKLKLNKSVVEITSPTNYPGEQFFFRKFSCLDFKENDNWMEANLTRWILNLIPPEVCLLWLFPKFYFTNLNQSGEHGNKFACCTRFLNFSTKLVKFSERAEKKEISLKQRDQNWSLINPMVSSWWAIHNYIKNVAQSCMLD